MSQNEFDKYYGITEKATDNLMDYTPLATHLANGQSGRITPSDSLMQERGLEVILQGDSLYGRVKDGITKAAFELDFSIDENTSFSVENGKWKVESENNEKQLSKEILEKYMIQINSLIETKSKSYKSIDINKIDKNFDFIKYIINNACN
jgi:hypothetical protein